MTAPFWLSLALAALALPGGRGRLRSRDRRVDAVSFTAGSSHGGGPLSELPDGRGGGTHRARRLPPDVASASSPDLARKAAARERLAAVAATAAVVVLWPSMPGIVAAAAVFVGVPIALRRLRGTPQGQALVDADSPLLTDLIASVLRSGAPLSTALRHVAAAAEISRSPLAVELGRVGGLLALGAEPEQAWARVAAEVELAELARVACRSSESGIRLAESFERVAVRLRTQRATTAQAKAERVGVWAVAPLGLCFLPAFLCLGIAPVVIGIGREIFASVSP